MYVINARAKHERYKKVIISVRNTDITEQGLKLKKDLENKHNVSFVPVSSVKDLFPLLNDQNFHFDYVGIDIEHLYAVDNVNVFAVLETISTLLKCSVVKDDWGDIHSRDVKMVILVGTKTSIELLKEVISLPMVSYIGLRSGDGFSEDEISRSLEAILNNDSTVPQQVQDMLNKRRKVAGPKNAINLTPRQRQIFNLVANRGASNKIIAKMLNISESTVKLHMGALLKKYKVRNRTQLAVFGKDQHKETVV